MIARDRGCRGARRRRIRERGSERSVQPQAVQLGHRAGRDGDRLRTGDGDRADQVGKCRRQAVRAETDAVGGDGVDGRVARLKACRADRLREGDHETRGRRGNHRPIGRRAAGDRQRKVGQIVDQQIGFRGPNAGDQIVARPCRSTRAPGARACSDVVEIAGFIRVQLVQIGQRLAGSVERCEAVIGADFVGDRHQGSPSGTGETRAADLEPRRRAAKVVGVVNRHARVGVGVERHVGVGSVTVRADNARPVMNHQALLVAWCELVLAETAGMPLQPVSLL